MSKYCLLTLRRRNGFGRPGKDFFKNLCQSEMDPRGGGGVWGGAHPPKIFQNAATCGRGGGGGRWWGVNCVIVTIECIVILGILIFYLSIQTLNHDIYFSDFDSQ